MSSYDVFDSNPAIIARLIPLTEATLADELEVAVLVDQLEVLNKNILRHDQLISTLFDAEGADAQRIAALPGAGPILSPRLYVALARHAPNTTNAEELAAAVGIAPVTDQSGKMRKVYRRLRCDTYTRQTFVEWAKESWKHSAWAESFVRSRLAKGQGFHAIIRSLAYKWIRILWKCWHDHLAYNEETYLVRLRQKSSLLVSNLPSLQSPK
ncbi:MAG TPA: transposase [Opitutaceae bacterium]|nr:transposase [Opitutaceae bacterium]